MRLICVTKRLSLFRATSVKFTDHTALYRILDNNGRLYMYIHSTLSPLPSIYSLRETYNTWDVDTMVMMMMLFFFKG